MFRILKIYWPLIILITLYTAYFSVTSILRYKYYYSGIFDLGHMTQVMWTTINGPFFTETDPAGTGFLVSRLTDHADFILILIAPIYAIFSSPEFLLILQSLIIALGAIPVFQFAKEKTESKFLPIFFACIYLLLPSVQNPNLADFHGVTLSMTFIAFAFYFLYKKKFKWGSVFVVLSLICKEQIGFTLSFIFLYFLFQNVKGKKIFISLKATFLEKKNENIFLMLGFILCLAYSFIMILVIIPNLRGSGSIYLNYYDGSGEGLGGILKTVIENPVNVVNSHYDGTVKYSGDLLFPVAGLSIFSPLILLISFPEWLIDAMSNNPALHSIFFQYPSVMNPFIIFSAIMGFFNLKHFIKKIFKFNISIILILGIIIAASISVYYLDPLPFMRHSPSFNVISNNLTSNDQTAMENLEKTIPDYASVSADNNLGSHFAYRKNIYSFPTNADWVDYLIIRGTSKDIPDNYVKIYNGDYINIYQRN